MRFLLALVGLTLAGSATTSPLQRPELTFEGLGSVRFGMPLVEAELTLGAHKHSNPYGGGEDGGPCFYADFGAYPNVYFMVEDGRIVRAEVPTYWPNALHLQVGMGLKAARRLHADVQISRNQYDPDGHDVLFWGPDRKTAFLAEEHKGRLSSIRAGFGQPVQYVEGCL